MLSEFQARIIKESARDGAAFCMPIFTTSFRFPDEPFYVALKQSGGEQAVAAYLRFFKRIALAFATHASDQVIEAQVADIIARLPRDQRATNLATPVANVASPDLQSTQVQTPSDVDSELMRT